MSGGTSLVDNTGQSELNRPNFQANLSAKDNEAIALFERGIEKESHGSMSDAVEFYRKAFKINDKVDLLYRTKRLPHKVNKLKEEGGKNITKRVDEALVRAIDVDKLLDSFDGIEASAPDPNNVDQHHDDIVTIKMTNLGLGEDKVLNLEPVSPLMHLPTDIWMDIFEILLLTNPESWFNFAITCKKNAYLGFGSKNIWRKLCYLIYPQQVYYENKLYLDSIRTPGLAEKQVELPVPKDQLIILSQYQNSWKYMLHNRPFIKFNGCYISVINYYSEGGKAEFSSSWSNPVKTITYYRYLRFYPDGTCIKVLSALEPNKVIPHLLVHNTRRSLLPNEDPINKAGPGHNQAPAKEGHNIYHGHWTISTSGEIHIEIAEGSVPYYIFHYHFQIKSLGGIFKHSKLSWIKYYAIRKKMNDNDEREGEETFFPLKNEKAFKFLKVRSYNVNN